MPIKLPVKRLQELCDPYSSNPWIGKRPIKMAEVRQAIERGTLEARHMGTISMRTHLGRSYHIKRIAWLVVNGWADAIEVDIGVPALGCHVDWPIQDGNHRFAAAIYRGDLEILANVSGDIGYGEELFGVDITEVYA